MTHPDDQPPVEYSHEPYSGIWNANLVASTGIGLGMHISTGQPCAQLILGYYGSESDGLIETAFLLFNPDHMRRMAVEIANVAALLEEAQRAAAESDQDP